MSPNFLQSCRWPLIASELKRLLRLQSRYRMEATVSVGVLAVMFLGFAWLGEAMGGRWSPFTGGPRVLAVLYAVWITASVPLGASASQVSTEAAQGLLEPLFLGAVDVTRVLQARIVAQLIQASIIGTLLLAAFCAGTHWWPSWQVWPVLLVGICACHTTTLGLALMLSGVALIHKRVQALMLPINAVCIWAILGGPASTASISGAAMVWPYGAASGAMRLVVEQGRVAPLALAASVLTAAICLIMGRAILSRCAMSCRRKGSIHVY